MGTGKSGGTDIIRTDREELSFGVEYNPAISYLHGSFWNFWLASLAQT
jgi:hypothetical protein